MIDIKWDHKFEVGHERIDHEHQVFVDLIRSVSLEGERHCPKDKGMRILHEVQKYAEFHFVSEENIMLDVGYPDYPAHHEEHQGLLRRLDEEAHRYYCDEIGLDGLANFMFEWFALHTTAADRRLTQYIAQGGRQAAV